MRENRESLGDALIKAYRKEVFFDDSFTNYVRSSVHLSLLSLYTSPSLTLIRHSPTPFFQLLSLWLSASSLPPLLLSPALLFPLPISLSFLISLSHRCRRRHRESVSHRQRYNSYLEGSLINLLGADIRTPKL